MAGCRCGSGELVFTAQNIIITTVAAFAFFGGIGFYLRWSYLGWRDGQRLSREPFLRVRDANAVLANAPKNGDTSRQDSAVEYV